MYGGKSFAGFFPVYYPEPVIDIRGAQVVMFQIICVFPDINVQDMRAGAEYGRILVGRSYNFKPSAVRYQPGVAGTEDGQSGLFKAGLKIFRTTELAGYLLEETEGEYSSFFRKAGAALQDGSVSRGTGCAAAGLHAFKIKTMIIYAACIVT